MRRKKISFGEITNRITGFEIPVFGGGISWNPPILDIDVARRLLTYLAVCRRERLPSKFDLQ